MFEVSHNATETNLSRFSPSSLIAFRYIGRDVTVISNKPYLFVRKQTASVVSDSTARLADVTLIWQQSSAEFNLIVFKQEEIYVFIRFLNYIKYNMLSVINYNQSWFKYLY